MYILLITNHQKFYLRRLNGQKVCQSLKISLTYEKKQMII